MYHFKSRIYHDHEDLQIMVDLIARVRPLERRNDYPGKVDLEETLASAAVRANTRLWFYGDMPIGWAYLDNYNNLIWDLDERYLEQVGIEIVKWGESRLRSRISPGETGDLYASAREDCSAKISFLKKLGFRQLENTTIKLVRSLTAPLPEPQLPPSFVIRPILGEKEAEAVAAMHRAAFGTEYMTAENRLIIMRTSEYDPSLDLVVIAPDGRISGNCICSTDPKEKIGFTDPVSIHPQFQGMGLARALLLTGMKMLKERGMVSAYLGTSGDNRAMRKTAESAGFTIEYTTLWFSKEAA